MNDNVWSETDYLTNQGSYTDVTYDFYLGGWEIMIEPYYSNFMDAECYAGTGQIINVGIPAYQNGTYISNSNWEMCYDTTSGFTGRNIAQWVPYHASIHHGDLNLPLSTFVNETASLLSQYAGINLDLSQLNVSPINFGTEYGACFNWYNFTLNTFSASEIVELYSWTVTFSGYVYYMVR